MVSVQNAADYLNTSERHAYYLISMGKIEAWKVGGIWRLNEKEVESYAISIGNACQNDTRAAGHPFGERDGGLPERVSGHGVPPHKIRRARGLPGGRGRPRVERATAGPASLSRKPLEPVKSGKDRLQPEFDFN